MDQQEITSTVQSLNRYVIDVWDWKALKEIVNEYVETVHEIDLGYVRELDALRDITTKVQAHLAAKYAEAIAEVDRVTNLLRKQPDTIGKVLLNQVIGDLFALRYAADCERHWTSRQEPASPFDYNEEPTERELKAYLNRSPEPEWEEEFPDHDRPWVFIAKHLAPFANNVAERIGERMRNIDTETTGPELHRLEWNCSTEAYVHIVKQLLAKGYIVLPGMNGKGGEGNVTETFRRLSQAITVRYSRGKQKGKALSSDELQRRFNGNGLPEGKAAKLDFPEAKEIK